MNRELSNKILDIIIKQINEDFDFSSIDIDISATDNYQATPALIREYANANVDMLKVFLSEFDRRIPSGFTHVDTVDGIGKVWHRSKAWEFVTTPPTHRMMNAYDLIYYSDCKWFNNSKNGWLRYTIIDQEFHKPNTPEYIKALIKGFGWDPDRYNFSVRGNYWLSPDKGVCIIERITCRDLEAQDPFAENRRLRIPSMIFYTGEVIYKSDSSLSKIKDKEIKILKKTQKFFDTINLPSKNFLNNSHRYIPVIAPNGEPIWVYQHEKLQVLYIMMKGDITDIDSYVLDPKTRYGLNSLWFSDTNAYLIDPNSWADVATNTIDFHAISDVFDLHIISDEKYLKDVIGQKALDTATKIKITAIRQPDKILYSGVLFLSLTPKFLKVYQDFMNNKIKSKDLYCHQYKC